MGSLPGNSPNSISNGPYLPALARRKRTVGRALPGAIELLLHHILAKILILTSRN